MCQTAGRDRGHRGDHDGGDVSRDRDTCTLETSSELAHNTGSSAQGIFNTSANVDIITTRSGKRAAELLMEAKTTKYAYIKVSASHFTAQRSSVLEMPPISRSDEFGLYTN